jgi:hypothetical protein
VGLITAAMEYLRAKAVDPVTRSRIPARARRGLQLAGTDRVTIGADIHSAFRMWSAREAIVNALWNSYSAFSISA